VETIASVLQLAMAQVEGSLRDQIIDRVSELDSIGDVMRQALDAMDEGRTPEAKNE
jgi:hypothetical protein